jgi:predicted nucleotidyltransferase
MVELLMDPSSDPILIRFRAALANAYGGRLERAVLFGSRARGDERSDSDYDVAVFLRDFEGIAKEMRPIAEIETDILLDTGAVISALPLRAGSYREATALMAELRREGREI